MKDSETFAAVIGLDGNAKEIEIQGVFEVKKSSDFVIWIHLDLQDEQSVQWIQQNSRLEPAEIRFMLAEETRPKFIESSRGVLLNLRALHPQAQQDEQSFTPLRCWADERRVLTASQHGVISLEKFKTILREEGPMVGVGHLINAVVEQIVGDIAEYVDALEEAVDDLAEHIDDGVVEIARQDVHEIQRKAAWVRRFISPQQMALEQFSDGDIPWFGGHLRRHMMESANEIERLVESLNFIWERAHILGEDVKMRGTEETNRRLYHLSILSAVFLPLTFLTGLLGVNLGGIPGTTSPFAFLILCGVILLVASGAALWFRRSRWL